MLFSDKRKHSLQVPAKDDKGNAVTVGWLVHHLCEEVMKDTRKEMFVLDDHVYDPYSISPLLNVFLLSNQSSPHISISGSRHVQISRPRASLKSNKLSPALFAFTISYPLSNPPDAFKLVHVSGTYFGTDNSACI
jgi:hypothetical protein